MTSKAKVAELTTPPKMGGTVDSGQWDPRARNLDIIKKDIAKRPFHVKFDLNDTEYQPIEKIGIGAYGVVCSAIHKKTSDKVAIKKIPCVFDALAIAKRTYREIKILKHFKHDNIILIREILKPKERFQEFKDIYVVFDLMESDLHRIIYSEQPLTEEHIRYFLYQILRGLKYVHSANVVHRDLKPSNLLVNEDCHVRIGDFGMARGVNSQQEEPSHYMTQYVATRWYRAPEILLSMLEYGTAVDIWSVGCIFAEMIGRKHLFPGKDYLSQVRLVLEVLGTPSEAVLKDCQNDVLKRIIRSLNHHEPMAWSKLFPKASRKALDLLGKMLVLNPAHRITVETALKHPFLSKYHDPDDEPICVPSFEFDFEKELVHMDRDHLRGVIYKEIMDFHQPRTPTLSFLACLRPVPKEDVLEEGGQSPSTASPAFSDQLQVVTAAATTAATAEETAADIAAASTATQEADMATSQGSLTQVVFKKPETRPATKKSPVSVDTSSLKLPPTSDVEMLSAQSVDSSKLMETQTPRVPDNLKDGNKEVKTGDTHKVKENRTISADTKALVKQALLSHRQRTESCGEDEKPRPVTAAQRQREREEKRKKKQEKKMKRMQDKKTLPPAPELSEADRELLARWSSMQKKPDSHQRIMPKPPQHAVAATTTTVTVVCLPQGIAAGSLGQSSSQSASPSTTPSILPKGLLPPGQLTILTATPLQGGQGQIFIQSGQIVGLQTVSFGLETGSLPASVSPQQEQTTFSSQQGLQLSFPDVSVMSLAEVQCQPGGQLHITETQAQALKETLRVNLAQDPAKRESGGFELTGPFQTYASPPQTPPHVQRNSSCGQFRNDPSQSPHHEPSSSPYYSHQSPHSFTPSPNPENAGDGIYFQAPAQSQLSSTGMVNHQSQQATHQATHQATASLASNQTSIGDHPSQHSKASLVSNQNSMRNHQSQLSNASLVSHPPQNLSEFLDRHCCEPAKVESAESVEDVKDFPADSVSTGIVNYLGKVTMSGTGLPNFVQPKAEQAAFGSSYFTSPQHQQQSAEFEDVKIVPQITDSRLDFSHQQAAMSHFTNHCQNTGGFSGDELSRLPFSSQGVNRNVSGVPYSVQQSCGATSMHTCQPYFVPADPTYVTSMRDNSVPFPLTAVMDDGSLPFSRYSHPQNLQSFQVSNEENLQVGFGLPSHTHSLSSAYHSDADSHASYSSHPNIAQAARHPIIPSQSLSHIHHHHHHRHQQVPATQELVNLSSSNFCLQQEVQYQSQQLHHQHPPPLSHSPHHHHHLQQLQLPIAGDPNHGQQHDQHLYHHQLQHQPSHSPETPLHHQQQQPPGSQDFHQQQAGAPHLQLATQSQTCGGLGQKQTSSGRLGFVALRVSAPKPDSQGVDLVAMLSSKLSNILPPSLSLTPRGTGAGYGVGMDLDVLMAESMEPINSRLLDMSPLSSSLLADWLEVTRNISQSDLDALEQDFGMTSPMAISYSELSTPNPSVSSNSTGNNNCSWLQ